MKHWIYFLSATVAIALSLTAGLLTYRNPDTRFVQVYEANHGPMSYEEGQLLAIGRKNCASLEAGYSLPDVYTDNIMTSMSGDQAAFTIETAIEVYCPQFKHLLKEMR